LAVTTALAGSNISTYAQQQIQVHGNHPLCAKLIASKGTVWRAAEALAIELL
jgi:hypothetical protein